MFKPSIQYFVKTHLFSNVIFDLLSCRRSFYLVKRSEFDYITGSLHSTQLPFHISYLQYEGDRLSFCKAVKTYVVNLM